MLRIKLVAGRLLRVILQKDAAFFLVWPPSMVETRRASILANQGGQPLSRLLESKTRTHIVQHDQLNAIC